MKWTPSLGGLSPEADLLMHQLARLLHAVPHSGLASRLGRLIDQHGADAIIASAKHQNVGAWLYVALTQGSEDTVESRKRQSLTQRLRPIWMRALVEEMLRRAAFDRITEILLKAGVRFAPWKGMDLAYRVYAPPEVRPMSDVDVLVPPGQFEAACDALDGSHDFGREIGVVEEGTGEMAYYNTHFQYQRGVQGSILFEIHHGVGFGAHLGVNYDALWSRAVSTPQGYSLLSAEDTLLVTAFHMVRSLFLTRLFWILDQHAIVDGLHPNWDVVVHRARRWGFGTGLWFALTRAAAILDRSIAPAAVLKTLAPSLHRQAYLQAILPPTRLHGPVHRFPIRAQQLLLNVPLLDGIRSRARYLKFQVKYQAAKLRR